MELSGIKREKDLRKIPFADLFNEIYDEPNGEDTALRTIKAIMPEFDDVYACGRVEAAKCMLFRDYLTSVRWKRAGFSQVSSNCISALVFYNQKINDFVTSTCRRAIEAFFDEGRFEDVYEILYEEYADIVNPVEGDKQHHGLIDLFVQSEARFNAFLGWLDQKISSLATAALNSSKTIKALYLLPRLESDQELIIFFGNNFHATLNSIDAYTGLLYASEFFDFDESMLASLSGGFTDDELESAKQAETSEANRRHEEEARREEQQRRAEQYRNAGREYVRGNYESAFKVYSELGDYRDAPVKAEESKSKWDEKAKADSIRAAALNVIPPIMVKGSWGTEYRVPWQVLAVDAELGKALMTTTRCVEDRPRGFGPWSECSLRKWLNGEFYCSLPEETRARIIATEIEDSSTDVTIIVEDKVFLLSKDEILELYANGSDPLRRNGERLCCKFNDDRPTVWWTRDLYEKNEEYATAVGRDGSLYRVEVYPALSVRPAIWVSIVFDD